MFSTFNAMADLEQARRNRPPPPGSNQIAALNMIRGMLPEAAELARLSKAGKPLPKTVPEEVYPGGVLPPGDVVKVQHYTAAPEFQAIDPAQWGSRAGSPEAAQYRNAEGSRMMRNPDLFNAQFYLPDYGSIPEGSIKGQTNARMIEGYLPGMYNATRDPDNIKASLQLHNEVKAMEAGLPPEVIPPQQLAEAMDREVRNRGYSGLYHEDLATTYKAGGYSLTPVDLTGAAPNIDAMRLNLGLESRQGGSPTRFPPGSPYAALNTETVPGSKYFAEDYKLYKDSPSAAAMLHSDMERLLKNPDGSSVVASELGFGRAPVRPAQGMYEGQRNPVAQARINVTPPRLNASMDADEIADAAQLAPHDQAKLDAIAVTEGILRKQDAVAWSLPAHMVDEKAMPIEGLPWKAVNGAVFRSPRIGSKELAQVGELLTEKVPENLKPWPDGETWEDFISLTEPADGSGGIMFHNLGLKPKVFQDKVREIRDKFPTWTKQRNMRTEWGRAIGNYITFPEYEEVLKGMPGDIRVRMQGTLQKLGPYAEQVIGYHHSLRRNKTQDPLLRKYQLEAEKARAFMKEKGIK